MEIDKLRIDPTQIGTQTVQTGHMTLVPLHDMITIRGYCANNREVVIWSIFQRCWIWCLALPSQYSRRASTCLTESQKREELRMDYYHILMHQFSTSQNPFRLVCFRSEISGSDLHTGVYLGKVNKMSQYMRSFCSEGCNSHHNRRHVSEQVGTRECLDDWIAWKTHTTNKKVGSQLWYIWLSL